MKIEMSHEIKSTKQPATQPVNHTNQFQKNLAQPATQPVNHTYQLQKNLAQPAKQHTSETTYLRNIYELNHPRLSQLYILIYQMTSNVIRLAMIGYQPTIKTHQTKDKRKAQIG